MKSPLAMTAENEFNQRNNDATTEKGDGGANQNASDDHSDPGWHLSSISNQHIKSAQTEERSACLFVEGRSDSGRLAGSVLKWASWLVGGWAGCSGAVAGLLQLRGVSQHDARQ